MSGRGRRAPIGKREDLDRPDGYIPGRNYDYFPLPNVKMLRPQCRCGFGEAGYNPECMSHGQVSS